MAVVIKRYRNRKLYNTSSKRYITINEIEDLVKNHEEVMVVDKSSGNDITAAILSLIILEHEKNQTGLLPVNLLTSLVQSGGRRLEEIRRNVFNALILSHHFDMEIERRINLLVDMGELSQKEGSKLLEKLLSITYTPDDMRDIIEERIMEFLEERQLPSKSDLQSLIDRVESLSAKVDELNPTEKETLV
jgi:polyhydroxyalkanoate synthesis repressor PhaR